MVTTRGWFRLKSLLQHLRHNEGPENRRGTFQHSLYFQKSLTNCFTASCGSQDVVDVHEFHGGTGGCAFDSSIAQVFAGSEHPGSTAYLCQPPLKVAGDSVQPAAGLPKTALQILCGERRCCHALKPPSSPCVARSRSALWYRVPSELPTVIGVLRIQTPERRLAQYRRPS